MIDLKWLENNAMFGCQNDHCATEVSYNVGMLKTFNGRPICEPCYEEESGEDDPLYIHYTPWDDLPNFNPFIEFRRNVLEEAAKWHEKQAEELKKPVIRSVSFPDDADAENTRRANHHLSYAAAIRAMGDSHD